MVLTETKRVLIIDNDDSVLDVMQEALGYEGFNVKGVTDPDNLFSIITDYKPDIIFMDFILNGINGGELCHQVKTNQHTHLIPVILISAYPRVLHSLGTYNCDAFISKPFDLSDLVNCINRLTVEERDNTL